MEAPLDGFIMRVAQRDTREANNYTELIREYSAAFSFALMGPEIKPPPENNPCCYGYMARFTILSHHCIQTK
jgi:hypothetical protein